DRRAGGDRLGDAGRRRRDARPARISPRTTRPDHAPCLPELQPDILEPAVATLGLRVSLEPPDRVVQAARGPRVWRGLIALVVERERKQVLLQHPCPQALRIAVRIPPAHGPATPHRIIRAGHDTAPKRGPARRTPPP